MCRHEPRLGERCGRCSILVHAGNARRRRERNDPSGAADRPDGRRNLGRNLRRLCWIGAPPLPTFTILFAILIRFSCHLNTSFLFCFLYSEFHWGILLLEFFFWIWFASYFLLFLFLIRFCFCFFRSNCPCPVFFKIRLFVVFCTGIDFHARFTFSVPP